MPELTIPELAALDARGYAAEIKNRLRDDVAWVQLLDPVLAERTRYSLTKIIESIDAQRARIGIDEEWLNRATRLRRLVKRRLDAMAPSESRAISNAKDARLWRALSARLARRLEAVDPDALQSLEMPYGGMSVADWLAARDEKQEQSA